LCLHQDVKKISIKHFNKKSEKAKDSKKCILHKQGGVWTYASEDDLLDELKNDPFLQEMAKVEHRRWCYYMSCHGWRYGKKKNEELKDNPCMCNWDSLAGDEEQKHKCKYDLMPLLAMLEMKEKQQSKKIKTKKHIH
jgi:hypothetical protein